MVVLNKIYTKTGDKGETALGDGTRVTKTSPRVEAYGTVDELNSIVGIAVFHAEGKIREQLQTIQNDLFDLGADLCVPETQNVNAEYPPLRMVTAQVERLESEIDQVNKDLSPLRSFILPGGTLLASYLHQCRTVARRAERLTVGLSEEELINPDTIKYLNRLSDWFFVMARVANNNGNDDILWIPGASRKN
ncbi:MAG: cob(I)yrinic acid a,c-diamide adenosyltransferase [Paracoccaceae bacterium]|nr:cob(I)yrinic acid a,c-diamide adenosyltransferase [Paracoccaceae bacterium]MDE2674563.1 cob(I)yrinic acid a,c-diamide adenosyltransferase [Paracoccaceae bacterium]MXZ50676.1 cob(I)yrinic acid a,c-diamide adenosyltransferase [Paracoccaceae bacterium]MYF46473.1 cob(I)yrinic acid a,c-diamide adenosyltransferase [Paracoccaceae bacterium]MYG10130.1 cob(I)yrinic acid a,c-diamide adenosyltransferase [Paracoccaceae bacterium]